MDREGNGADGQKVINEVAHFGVFILGNKLTAPLLRHIVKLHFLRRQNVYLKGRKS